MAVGPLHFANAASRPAGGSGGLGAGAAAGPVRRSLTPPVGGGGADLGPPKSRERRPWTARNSIVTVGACLLASAALSIFVGDATVASWGRDPAWNPGEGLASNTPDSLNAGSKPRDTGGATHARRLKASETLGSGLQNLWAPTGTRETASGGLVVLLGEEARCAKGRSPTTCGQPDVIVSAKGDLMSRLEQVAAVSALAHLSWGHLERHFPANASSAPPDQQRRRLHFRVLWGATAEDDVGPWASYFQSVRVAYSGHTVFDVQPVAPALTPPLHFQAFTVPAPIVAAAQRAEEDSSTFKDSAERTHTRQLQAMELQRKRLQDALGPNSARMHFHVPGIENEAEQQARPRVEALVSPNARWAPEEWELAGAMLDAEIYAQAAAATQRMRQGKGTEATPIPQVVALGEAADSALAWLRPSAELLAVMEAEAEEDMARLQKSMGVYLEGAPPSWFLPYMWELEQVPACIPDNLINCTVYHLATTMLRTPAQDYTVSSFWPSWAGTVFQAFHSSRAPLLLSATAARLSQCKSPKEGPLPALGPNISWKERDDNREAAKRRYKEAQIAMETIKVDKKIQGGPDVPKVDPSGVAAVMNTVIKAQVQTGPAMARSLLQVGLSKSTSSAEEQENPHSAWQHLEVPEITGKAHAWLGRLHHKRSRKGGWDGGHRKLLCSQILMGELFLLSLGQGLLRMSPYSIESRFILAHFQRHRQASTSPAPLRGTPSKEEEEGKAGDSLEEALCRRRSLLGGLKGSFTSGHDRGLYERQLHRNMAAPFTTPCSAETGSCGLIGSMGVPLMSTSMWAQNTHIDEGLGVLYCSIHKVGSTRIREWLEYARARQKRGQGWDLSSEADWRRPNMSEANRARLPGLGYNFDEAEAIRQVTRRDLFKFAFVRSPYSRTISAYQDKHVHGGEQKDRRYWNKLFFQRCLGSASSPSEWKQHGLADGFGRYDMVGIGRYQRPIPAQPPVLPFRTFVQMLHCVHRLSFHKLENHIHSQSGMCNLHGFKYDFVGHLEKLEEDARTVMEHTNLPSEARDPARIYFTAKSGHATNAAQRIKDHFNSAEVLSAVKDVYSCDLKVPLNGIFFSDPPVPAP